MKEIKRLLFKKLTKDETSLMLLTMFVSLMVGLFVGYIIGVWF